MENIFEILITKLIEVGGYDLIIFIFALTVFYAILKKYKILGESQGINAVVALTIAFLIFGYPVLVGFSLTLPLAKFFTQGLLWIMLFFMGILIASLFYPDLPKFISKTFKTRTVIWVAIFFTVVSLILSGFVSVLWASPPASGNVEIPFDLSITTAGVLLFMVALIIGSAVATSD